MSCHKEYVNPAGLRIDGRRPYESRQMSIEFGTLSGCDGSCVTEMGRSRVCATVLGPKESANRQEARHDEAIITCEVAVAAFAGEHRRNPQRRNKLADDISSAVVQVARSVVLLSQYPNSQIHIYVEILQNDGNEKVASISAACLALVDANVAMRDAVCCASVGLLDNTILVDLTTEELKSLCPTVAAAFTAHGTENIIWCETSSRMSADSVGQLMAAAQKSASTVFDDVMKKALEDHALEILKIQS